MVNLIIISNSPKTEQIERFLQSTIEVKIDVVADIDQALRDIFVMRPTVVCIQNRISDINADEIARHIKTLLRNGAPSFILMHEGDGSVQPVKGLFEHLLDLSLPETRLTEALGAALKSILGTQWEHVRLPALTQKNKPLKTTGTTPKTPQESPGAEVHDAFVRVNSLDEFMTTMPEALDMGQENSAHPDNTTPKPPQESPDAKVHDALVLVNSPDEFMTTMPEARDMGQENSAHPDNAPTAVAPHLAEAPVAAPRKNVSSRQLSVEYVKPAKSMMHEPLSPEDTVPSAEPVPCDFRITTTAAAAAGGEQNDIATFKENIEQPGRKWTRRAVIALATLVCTVALHLLRQKPVASTPVPLPPPAAAKELRKPTPVPTAVHKAISSVHPPVGNAAAPRPALPAFIPADGRDSAYAARHPGWESYAGTGYECRVFRENNRIKAVQVLSGNRQGLDEELLKKVLAELVGNDHYRVASRERVGGYLIERGGVVGKADLMLYTRDSKLHAFVVSLK